jgi:hypothetical protein
MPAFGQAQFWNLTSLVKRVETWFLQSLNWLAVEAHPAGKHQELRVLLSFPEVETWYSFSCSITVETWFPRYFY